MNSDLYSAGILAHGELYTAIVPDYQAIFEQRGQLYHQAMESYPACRAEEFRQVIAAGEISSGMTVLDVPSGGAYLADYLPEVTLVSLETSGAFAALAEKRSQSVILYGDDAFPLADNSVDRVLSIAGLHHIQHKETFFREAARVLKPDGRLVVADVGADSPVRTFLDDFVGQYCETGHSGWYFDDTTRRDIEHAGLKIVQDRILNYCWRAPDRQRLADFCRTLFGMTLTDVSTVERRMGDFLPVHEHADGAALEWQLHCFMCHPGPDRNTT